MRGLYLGPQAFTHIGAHRIKIFQTELSSETSKNASPGSVLRSQEEELLIACGKGSLSIKELQKASRSRQNVKDFLKGHPVPRGTCFQ